MCGGRTLTIGDIHGCAQTFCRLLEIVQLEKSDTLYLLGDMIDRGPDSYGVIETILDLQMEGYDIRPIRGNHEDMMLLAVQSSVFEDLLEWLEQGGDATLRSYCVNHTQFLPEEHLRFLEGLPLYRITDKFVFAHAGIDCTLDDPFSPHGRHHILWDRSGIIDVGKLAGRRVVSGHTTRKLDDIRKSLRRNHIRIDNGVYISGVEGKGNLVCVDLESQQMWVQACIDEISH
ncbi:serine/threonine protein phosphatase [Geomonas subterranea]|uniref:Serine/threonine protein phosphatase n=1 Tax=Geomonas subterranea TaxID=2847989 RepID=A0ABX8LEW6_9BACT|nr:metallophosphoesterase family protein [Geomonas subterranea]QXE89185.1 serine/threonine protein phosphatase [Geomonas subterranea]QXM08700.1 serine/threonine protein phosphatase [Geomonas subterranea]